MGGGFEVREGEKGWDRVEKRDEREEIGLRKCRGSMGRVINGDGVY